MQSNNDGYAEVKGLPKYHLHYYNFCRPDNVGNTAIVGGSRMMV